jgi:CheY-like chemotaxis protein
MNNQKRPGQDSLNILLVGNNPIELGKTLETVKKFPARLVTTEIAFNLAGIWERLLKFRPNFILIDDNIGLHELGQTVSRLSSNPKTRDVPITVLKNSNYSGSVVTNNISDYVLKQNLTPEALYVSLLNSLKFKRTRQYIIRAYKKRSGQLLNLVR